MLVDRLSSRAGVLGCWPVLGRLCLRGEKEGPSFPFSVFQDPSRWAPALHLTLHSQPGLKCGSSGETQGDWHLPLKMGDVGPSSRPIHPHWGPCP